MFPVVTALGGRRSWVRIAAGAVMAAVMVGSAACTGPQQTPVAGAAALVGTTRISDAALAQQVGELFAAGQRPTGTKDPFAPRVILSRDIIMTLLDVVAAENGVSVSQGELDGVLLKYEQDVQGKAAMEEVFLKKLIPPSQIAPWVRANLLAKALSLKLAPDQSIEQAQATLNAALTEASLRLGTQVSPRYGAWDPKTLTIIEAPNRLSVPAVPGASAPPAS